IFIPLLRRATWGGRGDAPGAVASLLSCAASTARLRQGDDAELFHQAPEVPVGPGLHDLAVHDPVDRTASRITRAHCSSDTVIPDYGGSLTASPRRADWKIASRTVTTDSASAIPASFCVSQARTRASICSISAR